MVQQDQKGAAVGRQTRNLEVLECRAATDGSAGTEPESQAFPGLGGGGRSSKHGALSGTFASRRPDTPPWALASASEVPATVLNPARGRPPANAASLWLTPRPGSSVGTEVF